MCKISFVNKVVLVYLVLAMHQNQTLLIKNFKCLKKIKTSKLISLFTKSY